MKTPAALGLPAKRFPQWRKGQERSVRELIFSDERFNLLCSPTGSGKSATVMAYIGAYEDQRAVYLTATRALQDQLDEFRSMGLADMRGRSNYICDVDRNVTAAEAICTAGVFCPRMKDGGCGYYDKLSWAKDARIVKTNYSFWLHAEESGSLGDFHTVVMDEAHTAPDQISQFAAVEVTESDCRSWGLATPQGPYPLSRPGMWASAALGVLEDRLAKTESVERRRKGRDLQRRLARLCRLSDEQWIASKPKRYIWRWDLLNPGALAEELMFRGAKRVILVSASARRKTLQLLGVSTKVKFLEQESPFPVQRRPIYYWPQASVGRDMPDHHRARLHRKMDEWMAPRLDRNGAIHSHSFELAEQIYERSLFRKHMILHRSGQDASDVMAEFIQRGRKQPVIVVSPSINTGVDMAYEIAEWQIIPKMPFPPMNSPLVMARKKADADYIPYVTMQTVVQAVGRIDRAVDDQGETLIMDSNFGWLKARYRDFAPRYFHVAVRTVDKDQTPPPPPPKLLTGGRQRI